MQKGDELKEFYFIGKTRRGCPIIKHRKIGDKGIKLIEVSNVGKSLEDGHIKKIRITAVKEDGKTEYKMHFSNVFTSMSETFLKRYEEVCGRFLMQKQKAIQVELDNIRTYSKLISDSIFVNFQNSK